MSWTVENMVFGEFYNAHYREMPKEWMPEITTKFINGMANPDDNGLWRITYPTGWCQRLREDSDIAAIDDRLRGFAWNNAEMKRIQILYIQAKMPGHEKLCPEAILA